MVIPVPAFKDNYVWLLTRDTGHAHAGHRDAAVVDPGDAAPVEAALSRHGLTLRAILLTHHHPDHVGGVRALLDARRGRDIVVYGPAGEAIDGVTQPLKGGDRIALDALDLRFRVIDIPGHTRGHIAYYGGPPGITNNATNDAASDAADDAVNHAANDALIAGAPEGSGPMLFCGDTLFAAGCGRIFEGTPQQMHASLSRLAALPSDTRVYCGHEYTVANLRFARAVEPDSVALIEREQAAIATRQRGAPTLPSTIALERATNPFLRSDEPAVRRAADIKRPGAGASAIETFTAIRQWKDSF